MVHLLCRRFNFSLVHTKEYLDKIDKILAVAVNAAGIIAKSA